MRTRFCSKISCAQSQLLFLTPPFRNYTTNAFSLPFHTTFNFFLHQLFHYFTAFYSTFNLFLLPPFINSIATALSSPFSTTFTYNSLINNPTTFLPFSFGTRFSGRITRTKFTHFNIIFLQESRRSSKQPNGFGS
ncbi:hypothetical protein MtrunA17_Chr5g0411531 [Medicago truncatula]|uniref:Uncharacterized protein n=1 Tax=Medicago truncatula TaxID=3880 RepID=A0A396HNC9_MEDTR|nr:hypothetical protein MtrunA17_Chr5g0411531 [Medicago truncatula]